MQLEFKIDQQIITRLDTNKVVGNSKHYLYAKFSFSKEWEGVEKTAVFRKADIYSKGSGVPYSVILEDDMCEVPHEVISDPMFLVSVFGGERITANRVEIPVLQSGYAEGETPSEPTPTVYEQILEKTKNMEKLAEDVVEGESSRVEAEQQRAEAENKRVQAEEKRVQDHTVREQQLQELSNISKELTDEAKALNEETKELNEKTAGVLDAETERVEAENIRQENEQNRIKAEEQRETLKGELEALKEETEIIKQDLAQTEGQFAERSQQALEEFISSGEEAINDFNTSGSHAVMWVENETSRTLEDFNSQAETELKKVQTATERANKATDRANEAVDNMPNVYANALKGTASGEVIGITDISPIEHNLGVKLSSKNLIPYPYADTTKTMNGITFTDNGDGSLTLNGTAGVTSSFFFTKEAYRTDDIGHLFKDGETYFISLDKNISGVNIVLVTYTYDDVVNCHYAGNSFTVDKSKYKYTFIRLQVNGGTTLENVTVKPMIEKGTKATSYTPYIDDVSTVKLNALGKNLIPYPYVDTTKTVNGITFTDNGDGSITCKGTATAGTYFILSRGIDFGENPFGGGSNWNTTSGTNGTYAIGKGMYYNPNGKALSINITNGAVVNETLYPQLEVGTTQTSYESYKEPTSYTPNADGTVEGVKGIYPNTTLLTDTSGVLVECEYNKDTNKVIENLVNAIISLGGKL